jgi:hypothetical protein
VTAYNISCNSRELNAQSAEAIMRLQRFNAHSIEGGQKKKLGSSREDQKIADRKKEEFSGNMENMRPENSFPRSALFLE